MSSVFCLSFRVVIFHLLVIALLLLTMLDCPPRTDKQFAAETGKYKFGIFGYYDISKKQHMVWNLGQFKLSDLEDSTSDWKLSADQRDQFLKCFSLGPLALVLSAVSFLMNLIGICCRFRCWHAFVLVVNILAFLASGVFTTFLLLVYAPHNTWLGWIQISTTCFLLATVFNTISVIRELARRQYEKVPNKPYYLGSADPAPTPQYAPYGTTKY
ncbi:unnamed protein product [Ambrosiozyma monospora]|uniref:Unnamed protein product n=1 Tax=Ambrosiozyma monospora TaxID=43982 RepID=A0A9W6YWB3_AMBMO|nr:unnamed protein product [Ambrosiozyma monospora]